MFELLLLSVVVTTAYLGPMILRRLGPGQRLYGLMIVADLVLALLSFISTTIEGENQTANTVGVIAIGAAFCLIMLPPMLRDLGRRFMAADRLAVAKLLAELRELLQPGMGARPEAELIDTVLAVREGREQEVVDALKKRRQDFDDPMAQRMLDERIVMTYLYAQRWADAVTHYELRNDAAAGTVGSPQLSVEMVRAYCESEQIEKAAELMSVIESSRLASEPVLSGLVARARMVFLAFTGRTGAVEAIVGPGGPLAQMPAAARSFWAGVARTNAGDLSGARSSLKQAIKLSLEDPRARRVAELRLARLDEPGALGPHSVPVDVAELADQLTSKASEMRTSVASAAPPGKQLPRLGSIPLRLMPVTVALVLANIVVSLLVYLAFGGITDLGALIASGANLKSATLDGEWWRLASSMFLHVGVAHLALNLYGLWVLGRLIEQTHGSLRTLAVYGVSGVIGALASTYFGGSTTAVGASGAVMGLMGAAIAEFGAYRSHYPKRWVSPLFGMLVVLTLAQVAVGFFYPIVDQWGHVGGLLGGAGMGLVLSPNAGWLGRLRSGAGVAFATASVGFFAYAAVMSASTSYTQTLRRYDKVTREVGGLRLEVPNTWERVGPRELYDSGAAALLDVQRLPASAGLDAAIAARLESEHLRGGALRAGFDRAKPAARTQMALPAPWRGGELIVTVDGSSGLQRYRLVVFARVVDQEIWLGAYYHPSALTEAIEPVFAEILMSMHADPTSPQLSP